jgi:HEAT repeat protein
MNPTDLCEALRGADGRARRKLLQAVPPSADAAMLAEVAQHLGDPLPEVCEAAVDALARAENETAAQLAAQGLCAADPAERGYALEALVCLGTAALPILERLLQDQDQHLRKYALDALARIRHPGSLPLLCAALEDVDPNVAAAAAEALGALALPDAVPALGSALRRGPDWVRLAALAGLGAIGDEDALHLICSVPQVLGRGLSPLVHMMAIQMAWCAAGADPLAAFAFLKEQLRAADPAVQDIARSALVDLPPGSNLSGWVDGLAGASQDPDVAEFALALRRKPTP